VALILVGGQAKHVGKTTLVCNIISAFPQLGWSAAKITNHKHEVTGCELLRRSDTWSIWEQTVAGDQNDTARFLRAGAKKAYLLQAEDADPMDGWKALRTIVSEKDVIVESSRAAGFLHADLFLMMLDGSQSDFKASSLQQLEKVSAFLWKDQVEVANSGLGKNPNFPALRESLDSRLVTLIEEVVNRS
jgi:hypothetical protein